jgi:hypothetical protein
MQTVAHVGDARAADAAPARLVGDPAGDGAELVVADLMVFAIALACDGEVLGLDLRVELEEPLGVEARRRRPWRPGGVRVVNDAQDDGPLLDAGAGCERVPRDETAARRSLTVSSVRAVGACGAGCEASVRRV